MRVALAMSVFDGALDNLSLPVCGGPARKRDNMIFPRVTT